MLFSLLTPREKSVIAEAQKTLSLKNSRMRIATLCNHYSKLGTVLFSY